MASSQGSASEAPSPRRAGPPGQRQLAQPVGGHSRWGSWLAHCPAPRMVISGLLAMSSTRLAEAVAAAPKRPGQVLDGRRRRTAPCPAPGRRSAACGSGSGRSGDPSAAPRPARPGPSKARSVPGTHARWRRSAAPSSSSRQRPMASKFSRPRPSGSNSRWQLRQGSTLACWASRSRRVVPSGGAPAGVGPRRRQRRRLAQQLRHDPLAPLGGRGACRGGWSP